MERDHASSTDGVDGPLDATGQYAIASAAMGRPWDAIAWWEIRRIPYNLVILAVGTISFGAIEFIGSYVVEPGEDAMEPLLVWVGVAAYGLAANLCYTLGWMTEILWTRGDTTLTEAIRPKVFRIGLAFSALVTLSPAVLIPLSWAVWGVK